MDTINQIDEILNNEISLFKKIYESEKGKKKALLKRDAALLDDLSYKQDKYISQIDQLEDRRSEIHKMYAEKYLNRNDDSMVTLKEIVEHEKPGETSELLKKGKELKSLVENLSKLQELNRKMIKDNIDMIGAVLNEIKEQGTVHMGYDNSGKEQGKLSNPVLFNKTV